MNDFWFLTVPFLVEEGQEEWHGAEVENEVGFVDPWGPAGELPPFLSAAQVQIESFLQLPHPLQDQQQHVRLTGLNTVVDLQS